MAWIFIVITAQLLNAIVFIIDKFLLSKKIPHPVVYAFYVGMLQIFIFAAVIFLPLFSVDFGFPGLGLFILSLLAGMTFIYALVPFFTALSGGEASRVVPVVGGAVPIFTFILSYFFLFERLGSSEIIAFVLFVIGGIIISINKKVNNVHWFEGFALGIFAGFLFAVSFVITKYVYDEAGFIIGFFWMRLGAFIAGLSFFIIPKNVKRIMNALKEPSSKVTALFLLNQAMGALGFILIQVAISLASVTLVNAMQGVQYAFLFIIAIILSKKFPQLLREQVSKNIVVQKTVAIILITIGFIVLF